jgi:hypothetical protein
VLVDLGDVSGNGVSELTLTILFAVVLFERVRISDPAEQGAIADILAMRAKDRSLSKSATHCAGAASASATRASPIFCSGRNSRPWKVCHERVPETVQGLPPCRARNPSGNRMALDAFPGMVHPEPRLCHRKSRSSECNCLADWALGP